MSKKVTMQTRCIACGREQYAMAVYDISHGQHPCVWCGVTPPVFTDDKTYRAALSPQPQLRKQEGSDAIQPKPNNYKESE